jgi:hypothetical protein
MVQLPCPHCGKLLSKPWWRCFPSRAASGDFFCTQCGQHSYFPKAMRLGGILLGMTAGAIVMLVANLVGFDRHNPLAIAAWLLPTFAVYWAVAAFVCSRSSALITTLWGLGR